MMTRSPIKVFSDLLSGTNRMQALEEVTKMLNGPRDPLVAEAKKRGIKTNKINMKTLRALIIADMKSKGEEIPMGIEIPTTVEPSSEEEELLSDEDPPSDGEEVEGEEDSQEENELQAQVEAMQAELDAQTEAHLRQEVEMLEAQLKKQRAKEAAEARKAVLRANIASLHQQLAGAVPSSKARTPGAGLENVPPGAHGPDIGTDSLKQQIAALQRENALWRSRAAGQRPSAGVGENPGAPWPPLRSTTVQPRSDSPDSAITDSHVHGGQHYADSMWALGGEQPGHGAPFQKRELLTEEAKRNDVAKQRAKDGLDPKKRAMSNPQGVLFPARYAELLVDGAALKLPDGAVFAERDTDIGGRGYKRTTVMVCGVEGREAELVTGYALSGIIVRTRGELDLLFEEVTQCIDSLPPEQQAGWQQHLRAVFAELNTV